MKTVVLILTIVAAFRGAMCDGNTAGVMSRLPGLGVKDSSELQKPTGRYYGPCPKSGDSGLSAIYTLLAATQTSVSTFAKATASARADVSAFAAAAAVASTTAGALSHIRVSKGHCIAADAGSAAMSLAGMAGKAIASASASSAAFGVAMSDAYATALGFADIEATLFCPCADSEVLVAIRERFANSTSELEVAAHAYKTAMAELETATAAASAASTALSSSTARVCLYCAPGFRKETVQVSNENGKSSEQGYMGNMSLF